MILSRVAEVYCFTGARSTEAGVLREEDINRRVHKA